MKIGVKPKSYTDVICFDIPDKENAQFIDDIFNSISVSSEEELDFVVTVTGKKKDKIVNKDFYQIVADELNITREEAKKAILNLQYKGENKTE